MMQALYLLRLVKRYILGQISIGEEIALAIIKLCLSEGISKSISQSSQ